LLPFSEYFLSSEVFMSRMDHVANLQDFRTPRISVIAAAGQLGNLLLAQTAFQQAISAGVRDEDTNIAYRIAMIRIIQAAGQAGNLLLAEAAFSEANNAGVRNDRINIVFDIALAQTINGSYRYDPYDFIHSRIPLTGSRVGGILSSIKTAEINSEEFVARNHIRFESTHLRFESIHQLVNELIQIQHIMMLQDALPHAETAVRLDIERQYNANRTSLFNHRAQIKNLYMTHRLQAINELVENEERNVIEQARDVELSALHQQMTHEKETISINEPIIAESAGRSVIEQDYLRITENKGRTATIEQNKIIRAQWNQQAEFECEKEELNNEETKERAKLEKEYRKPITLLFSQHRQTWVNATETLAREEIKSEEGEYRKTNYDAHKKIIETEASRKKRAECQMSVALAQILLGERSVPAAQEYHRLMMTHCKMLSNLYHEKMLHIFRELELTCIPFLQQNSCLYISHTQYLLANILNKLQEESNIATLVLLFKTVKVMIKSKNIYSQLIAIDARPILDLIENFIFADKKGFTAYPFRRDRKFQVFLDHLFEAYYQYALYQSCGVEDKELARLISTNKNIISDCCLRLLQNAGDLGFDERSVIEPLSTIDFNEINKGGVSPGYKELVDDFLIKSQDFVKPLQDAARDLLESALSPSANGISPINEVFAGQHIFAGRATLFPLAATPPAMVVSPSVTAMPPREEGLSPLPMRESFSSQ